MPSPQPIPLPPPLRQRHPEAPLARWGRRAGHWAYRARAGSERWFERLRAPRPPQPQMRPIGQRLVLAAAGGFLLGVASGWRRGRNAKRARRKRGVGDGHPHAA